MNPKHTSTFRLPTRRPATLFSAGLMTALAGLFLSACGQSAPPAAEPSPTPAPASTPTPAATATATPTPMTVAKYNGVQQMEYMATARDAFIAERQAKSQPYIDAHNAFEAAGGVSAKGLATKEDIAARRDLLAKCNAGNDEYLEFVKTQEDTYRAELSKTPLLSADVDSIVADYASKANSAAIVKLRETEREALKAGDDMLAVLDKSYGDWSVNAAGALTFKKKSMMPAFESAAKKYNALATDEVKMREEVNKALVVPSASAPPSPSPGVSASASPGVSASPAVPKP